MHLCFIGRITNPPVLISRTFFYCGLQIRRDAWRWTFWNRQALSSVRRCLPSGVVFRQALSSVRRCLPSGVVFRQAFRRICNPASKNVRPYYFADLQSAYLRDYFIARIILFFPKASSLVSISLKSSFSSISRVSFS